MYGAPGARRPGQAGSRGSHLGKPERQSKVKKRPKAQAARDQNGGIRRATRGRTQSNTSPAGQARCLLLAGDWQSWNLGKTLEEKPSRKEMHDGGGSQIGEGGGMSPESRVRVRTCQLELGPSKTKEKKKKEPVFPGLTLFLSRCQVRTGEARIRGPTKRLVGKGAPGGQGGMANGMCNRGGECGCVGCDEIRWCGW